MGDHKLRNTRNMGKQNLRRVTAIASSKRTVSWIPQTTLATRTDASDSTCTGRSSSSSDPLPNLPYAPLPQQYNAPSPELRPKAQGSDRRWPQYAAHALLLVTAALCSSPQEMEVTWCWRSEGTTSGELTYWYVICRAPSKPDSKSSSFSISPCEVHKCAFTSRLFKQQRAKAEHEPVPIGRSARSPTRTESQSR